MKEIKKMSSMSLKTPPMIASLIDLLKYNINTPYCDQLLIDIALYISSLHDHTKSFLKQLRAIKGMLPLPSTPITEEEHMEEVNSPR